MLASNGLIGLREGLEAALVVSILVSFLVRSDQRAQLRWVWLGVGLAVLLSVTIGALLTYGTAQLSFTAQEAVGGIGSVVAVGFVTGMVFWMRSAARTIASGLRGQLTKALEVGALAVAVVAFLAVAREGLETAIFFYAAVQSAGVGTGLPLLGFLLGIAVAVLLGWLIYRGTVHINLGVFFRVTGVLLIIVAAGILAYGMHDLQEAAILPGLHTLAFDVSAAVPPDSWYGVLLKGILNFSPQTTVLEAVVWVSYVGIVMALFLAPQRSRARPQPSQAGTSGAPVTAEAS
ncbi:MAG: iron uptake transporter permease EfeU [Pseudonocardiaceae bacterium]